MSERRRGVGLALACGLLAGVARADIAPSSRRVVVRPGCVAPSKAMRAEINRLFKLAAEHATRSNLCQDGPGEITTIAIDTACVQPDQSVTVTYEVTVKHELGGECTPYPACADGGSPTRGRASASLVFAPVEEGVQLVTLPKLPAVTLLTPLDKPHSMACKGKSPAYAPRTIAKP